MSHLGYDATTIRHTKADFLPTSARFEVEVVEAPAPRQARRAREEIIKQVERRYVELVLAAHGGQSGEAAVQAGVSRRYLNMLRTRFGL